MKMVFKRGRRSVVIVVHNLMYIWKYYENGFCCHSSCYYYAYNTSGHVLMFKFLYVLIQQIHWLCSVLYKFSWNNNSQEILRIQSLFEFSIMIMTSLFWSCGVCCLFNCLISLSTSVGKRRTSKFTWINLQWRCGVSLITSVEIGEQRI